MKRDFLKGLGLSDEAIDSVMAENGRDVQELKAAQSELASAKAELEKLRAEAGELEEAKADAAKWKAEAESTKADTDAKLAALELKSKVREFTLAKPFVNDITREAIALKMEESLSKDGTQDMDAVLKALTDGKADVWKQVATPPTVPPMAGSEGKTESGVVAAFKRLNPNIKIE